MASIKKTILIVDDDNEDIELFFQAILKIDSKINCITASNGEEALKILNSEKDSLPDCIFLDLNMPRMNGKKCLIEIKKISRLENIPVIICSTSKSKEDERETKNIGAAYFLKKPSTFKELLLALKYILSEQWLELEITFAE